MNKGIYKFQVFRRRKPACKVVAALTAFALLTVTPVTALATSYLGGNAELTASRGIGTAIDGGNTATFTIEAGKSQALLDWSKLNVGSGQTMAFDGNATFYNVVSGTKASEIAGTLKAVDGNLWIFNPAGISFVDGAQVTVGGTFGAVAASLTDGTRKSIEDAFTTPATIGSLAFEKSTAGVDVKGGTFSANQVALMGRTVTVDGGANFKGVNRLTLGAAEKLSTVDDVAGGTVSIKINEFADSDADISVAIGTSGGTGEMVVGDTTSGKTGDLDILTEGNIVVNEAVKASGKIDFTTLPRSVSGPTVSAKKISVASGKLLQGKSVSAVAAGKISAEGSIVAGEGAGDVSLTAADGIEVSGVIKAGAVTATSVGKDISLANKGNSIGSFTASGAAVQVADGDGKLVLGNVQAKSLKIVSSAEGVEVESTIDVDQFDASGIEVGVYDGCAEVDVDGTLTAGKLTVVGGTVNAKNIVANVKQSDGKITVKDTVDGTLTQTYGELKAKKVTGAATVSGEVYGDDGLAFGSTLVQEAAGKIDADGELTVGGTAELAGTVKAGHATIGGKLTQTGGAIELVGALNLGGGAELSSTVIVNAIDAAGVEVKVVGGGADVDVAGTLTASTLTVGGGAVDAENVVAKVEQSGGTLTVTDTVEGALTQTGGKLTAKKVTGAATVSGEVYGDEGLTFGSTLEQTAGKIDAGTGTLTLGADATVKGTINATTLAAGTTTLTADGATVTVTGADGITAGTLIQKTGTIMADKINAVVEQAGAGTIKANGATGITFVKSVTQDNADAIIGENDKTVTINGALMQEKGTINASTLMINAANVKGTVNATSIAASTGMKMIKVEGGTVTVTGADGITAGTLIQNAGTIKADKIDAVVEQTGAGTIKANGATGITFVKNVTQNNAGATIGENTKTVTMDGELTQNAGTINASTLTLGADGNALGGTVTADAIAGGKTMTVTGTVTADALTANVTQNAGTIAGKTSADALVLTGTFHQDATDASTKLTAKEVTGAITESTTNKGTMDVATAGDDVTIKTGTKTFGKIKGNLTVDGGTLVAKNDALTVGKTTKQNGGVIGDANDTITLNGALTQDAGLIKAKTLTLKDTTSQSDGCVLAGELLLDADGKAISLETWKNEIDMVGGNAGQLSLWVSGDLTVKDLTLSGSGKVSANSLNVAADATLSGTKLDLVVWKGGLTVNAGAKVQGGTASDDQVMLYNQEGAIKIANGAEVSGAKVELTSNNGVVEVGDASGKGTVRGGTTVTLHARDGVHLVNADVTSGNEVTVKGALTQDAGKIEASTLMLGANSTVKGTVNATTLAAGTTTLTADGATVTVTGADGITAGTLIQKTGTIAADKIDAVVEQTGAGTIKANGATGITFVKNVTQNNAGATIGEDTKTVTMDGALTQNAGTINASTLTLGADGNALGGTVTADAIAGGKTMTVTGTVTADALTANVTQNAGTIAGKTSADALVLTGTFHQDATDASTKLTAKEVTGAITESTTNKGTMDVATAGSDVTIENGTQTFGEIKGNLTVNGGTLVAKNDALTVAKTTTQKGGIIGDANDTITLNGALTQDAGKIEASMLTLGANSTMKGTVNATTLAAGTTTLTADGATVTVTGADGITAGSLIQKTGTIKADKIDAVVEQTGAGTIKANGATGITFVKNVTQNNAAATIGENTKTVTIGGALTQKKGTINASTLTLKDTATQTSGAAIKAGELALDADGKTIGLTSSANDIGSVGGNAGQLNLYTAGNIAVKDTTMEGQLTIEAKNNLTVNADAQVQGKGGVSLTASSGKLKVSENATVKAGDFNVDLATGDITKGAKDPAAGANLKLTAGGESGSIVLAKKSKSGASGQVSTVANQTQVDQAYLVANGALAMDAKGSGSSVQFLNGSYVGGNSTVTIGGTKAPVSLSVDESHLVAKGDLTANANIVSIDRNAKIASDKNLAMSSLIGNFSVGSGSKVLAANDLTLTSARELTIMNATVKAGSFNETTGAFDPATDPLGKLTLEATGVVDISSGAKVGANGRADDEVAVSIMSKDSDVRVTIGTLAAGKGMNITAKNELEIDNAQSVAKGDLSLTAGKVLVNNASKVASDTKLTVKSTDSAADSVVLGDKSELLARENIVIDSAKDITTVADSRIAAQKGNLDLDAAGEISVAGTITGKDADFKAGGNITLANAANDFTGVVNADGVNLSIVDKNGIVLGEVAATDTLGVEAKDGSITQTTAGKVTATGVTTLKATKDITLANAENDFTGAVNADGVNLTLVDKNDILLGKVAATGTLGVEAKAGSITQTTADKVEAAGVTTLKATADVTLNNAANDFTGAVNADGVNVKLKDKDALTLGTVQAGGLAVLEADGLVTVNGAIKADGNVRVASDNNAITLNGNIDAKGNVTVKAKGDISQNADITTARAAGKTVDIEADQGSITMANGKKTTTDNGTIAYVAKAADKNVTVATVNAGKNGAVYLKAGGSATTTADGKVTGSDIAMDVNQIGTAENPLNLSVGTLALKAKNGIYVKNDQATLIDKTDATPTKFKVQRVDSNGADAEHKLADGTSAVTGLTVTDGPLSLELTAGSLTQSGAGLVTVKGDTTLKVAAGNDINLMNDNNDFQGTVNAEGDVVSIRDANSITLGQVTARAGDVMVLANNGDLTVNGNVNGAHDVILAAAEGAAVIGQITAGATALIQAQNADVAINGQVNVGEYVLVDAARNVTFGSAGQVKAGVSADILAGGDITQDGAQVDELNGTVTRTELHAAVDAKHIDLQAGGNIGKDTFDYVAVNGSVHASAGGRASVAAAGTSDLTVDEIKAKDVSVYTTGKLVTDGTLVSDGGSMTVAAREFGGIANASFGQDLIVENFSDGSHPLLAMFRTKDGNRTPNVINKPNDVVIFIDGRLAGGDIRVINKLGAMEAFPVQTPELKSEQGVFGNPNFLHDELDVANPFAVGAIDFLLQDIPLLMLSSDFPLGIEKQVAAAGLNPRTSYWFGQNPEKKDIEEEIEKEEQKKPTEKKDSGEVKNAIKTAMN